MPWIDCIVTKKLLSIHLLVVYTQHCGTLSCEGKQVFDGQSMCLLVMRSFCVTYEVLRHHMHQFLLGRLIFNDVTIITYKQYISRTTIHTEYSVLCQDHKDAGNENIMSILSYQQYLTSWYLYLQLLEIDYDAGFVCKLVSDNVKQN